MDWKNPLRSIATTVDVDVLQALGRAHTGVTGLQLAQLSGRSYAQVSAVVDRLVEHGVVHAEQIGRTYSYELNREHVAASAIEGLLDSTTRTEHEITSLVSGWEVPPVSVALFGSAARREADATSDVDLLVVRSSDVPEDSEAWASQLGELVRRIERFTGNRVQLVDISRDELDASARSGVPLVASLEGDARTLSGVELRDLIAGER